MDSVDWAAGFEGVSLASIVLGILFLTVPGIALARGLAKYRVSPKRPAAPALPRQEGANPRTRARTRAGARPSGGGTGKKKRSFVSVLASVGTVLALLGAGLGLVPLMLALYRAIDHKWEYGAAIVGLIALVLLIAKVLAMVHDLKDGKMDHPMLWLAPIPLVAMLVWGGPALWDQMTDQAGKSAQAIFGDSGNSDDGDKPEKDSKKADGKTEKKDRRSDNRGADREAGERP